MKKIGKRGEMEENRESTYETRRKEVKNSEERERWLKEKINERGERGEQFS